MTDAQRIELIRAAIARIQVQRLGMYQLLDSLLDQFNATYVAEEEAQATREQIKRQVQEIRTSLANLEQAENQYKANLEALQNLMALQPEEEKTEEEQTEEPQEETPEEPEIPEEIDK